MTEQQQLRNERVKSGAITATIMAIFVTLATTFSDWWPVITGLFQNSQEELRPIDNNRIKSPDICKSTFDQSGPGNKKIEVGGDVNVCSPQSNYQFNPTYNPNTIFDSDITLNTEANYFSTKPSNSASLSYHAAVSSSVVSKGLLAVMPYLGISQRDSSLISNVSLSNEAFLGKKVLAKQLAAGLRKDTIDSQLVKALGYNPEELLSELVLLTSEGIDALSPIMPSSREFNPNSLSEEGNSKYEDCWRAEIPPSGSNHCNKGDHLF